MRSYDASGPRLRTSQRQNRDKTERIEKINMRSVFISTRVASPNIKDVTFRIHKEWAVSSLPLFGAGGG